ncbi:hypothetical protein CK203_052576 [Vitis vinifera]|uniref:Uncharacterized protein n=1 Tax=Vitis vinifera TaxID=29760 RepID=A0A438FW69_VITVI|nr:hypothetical protein CK203_052576 [Vitis vinifera]
MRRGFQVCRSLPYSFGGRDLSSPSSSSFGRVTTNEGTTGVSFSEGNEEEQTPLCIILADGSKGVLVSEGEKQVAGEGPGGEFEGCFRIWMGAGGTTVTWRGLANSWASPRTGLKGKF